MKKAELNTAKLRCSSDLAITQQLCAEPLVKQVIERLESGDIEGPQGVRRRLLGASVQLYMQ